MLEKKLNSMRTTEYESDIIEPEFINNLPTNNDDEEFVVQSSESLDDWIEDDHSLINEIKAALGGSKTKSVDSYEDIGHSPVTSIDHTNAKEYAVVFTYSPLGLTLARGASNQCAVVVKIKSDGHAYKLGVLVGDVLVSVNGYKVQGYDDAMPLIAQTQYPVTLTFHRGLINMLLQQTGDAVIKGSKVSHFGL